jgi:histidinol-phosphate aminotransferase
VRKHLLNVPAYTPIEPFEVLSARYGRTPEQIVKLDANENPYGPPPEVRQALAEMPWPHIYPDPETRRLRAALAESSGVPVEHLLVSFLVSSGGDALCVLRALAAVAARCCCVLRALCCCGCARLCFVAWCLDAQVCVCLCRAGRAQSVRNHDLRWRLHNKRASCLSKKCKRVAHKNTKNHNTHPKHKVGCGADELIDLLMRCTLDAGDCIVDCPPTFTMYAFDADINAARTIVVPRLDGFRLDVDGIRRAVAEHKPKLLFLTSPNNPDGSVITDAELESLLELPVLVVLDEAYIEFSDLGSKVSWVPRRSNLVVLRTFSKCAALAGLRVGWGAFPLDLAEYLWRAKQPYNVSVAAETAACAALTNPGYLDRVRDALVTERERLIGLLRDVPFLEPYPSHANFVLCKVTQGRDAKAIKDALAQAGVMVRHYAKKELSGYVRVSVGKPEHTDALMAALRAL